MRSDGPIGANWAVIIEYMLILKVLMTAAKRLEWRGTSGSFGAELLEASAWIGLVGEYRAHLLRRLYQLRNHELRTH